MNDKILFETEVTGMPVQAYYTGENTAEIFLPLIQKMIGIRKAKGRRILVFLAAPPATGKSTLAAYLASLCPGITVLPMDGFHCPQRYLLSHTVERNGKKVPAVSVKGAPDTFDTEKLARYIRRAARGEVFCWPEYDRRTHDPRENAIPVQGDILLIEGNYLLLDRDGWRDLYADADLTVFIRAEEALLRPRLINRKTDLGKTREEAERFADESDLVNARLVLEHSIPADITLILDPDGTYRL